jgi:trk system potassium uptake protein TrkA
MKVAVISGCERVIYPGSADIFDLFLIDETFGGQEGSTSYALEAGFMKVIVLGCGRVGATLASSMSSDGHDVTVIDRQGIAFRRLSSVFKGRTLVGNGSDVDVLRKAGIEEADAFVAVTQGDNTNLLSVQLAKEKFKVKKCVARVYDPIRACAYQEMGVETLCTTLIGARLFEDAILGKPFGMASQYCALEGEEVLI